MDIWSLMTEILKRTSGDTMSQLTYNLTIKRVEPYNNRDITCPGRYNTLCQMSR
jgi:hypothetical protein